MRIKYAAAALTTIAIAVAILLLYKPLGGSVNRTNAKGSETHFYVLALEVEGYGRLLINGSSLKAVNFTKPFKAIVEAVPETCYVLNYLEVNGTPINFSLLELYVAGNTTVKAVFVRPRRSLLILSNALNASALVNGTLFGLPIELKVNNCEVLNVTPVAPSGFRPLNESMLVRLEEDRSIMLAFRRASALIHLTNILAPVRVNNTLYEKDSLLESPFNVTLLATPVTDQRGCTEYNDTHLVCVTGWRVRLFGWSLNNMTDFDYPSRVIPIKVGGDMQLKQFNAFVKRRHPVKSAEIITPEGVMRVKMIPADRWFVVPFVGDYEYVGDSWIRLEGRRVGVFLEMPEKWGKIRIYVKHIKPEVLPDNYVGLVVRNTVDYLELSFVAPPCCGVVGEGEAIFSIDWRVLEVFKEPGYDPWPLGGPRDPRVFDYLKLERKSCSPNVPRYYCVDGVTQAGPSGRTLDSIKEGWLYIACSGVLYVKVEVVEWRP